MFLGLGGPRTSLRDRRRRERWLVRERNRGRRRKVQQREKTEEYANEEENSKPGHMGEGVMHRLDKAIPAMYRGEGTLGELYS